MIKKFIIPFNILIFSLCMNNVHAQNFFPMPPGFGTGGAQLVRAVFPDTTDGSVYAGGQFYVLGNGQPMHGIARWNGSQWDSVGFNTYAIIHSIKKYNGQIYAGGVFNSIGGVVSKGLAKWDGTSWNFVANLTSVSANGCVFILYIDGNDLYVGGCFDSINGIPAQGIVRYDGTTWHTYPSIYQNTAYVNAIAVYNGELHIAGNFNPGNGKNDIAKYDGSNWVSIGGGLSGANTVVDGMIVHQSDLYIIGYFMTAFGDPGNCIAKWNGTSWSTVGTGVTSAQLFGITVFNNEIYVAGNFNSIGGVSAQGLARWDGTLWHDIGAYSSPSIQGFELAGDNTNLYITGGFVTINGDTMNGITRYNLPVGIEENAGINDVNIFPNPITIKSTFTFINPHKEKFLFTLYDITGRVTETVSTATEEIILNKGSKQPGLYLFSLRNEKKGVVMNGKIIIE